MVYRRRRNTSLSVPLAHDDKRPASCLTVVVSSSLASCNHCGTEATSVTDTNYVLSDNPYLDWRGIFQINYFILVMVKHLPPVVKQLLTQRHPHPFPSPSVQKLNAVLHKTFGEAKRHKAEDGWLVLSVGLFNPFSSVSHADNVLSLHDVCNVSPLPCNHNPELLAMPLKWR